MTVENSARGHQRNALIDGVAEGFPANATAEWASLRGGAGTRVRLFWEMPEEISCIWLFDRPNPSDHVLSARVEFSDGSAVEAEALSNDGNAPRVLTFSPRTIQWIDVTVTGVSPATRNVGFSEIAVFDTAPQQQE